MVRSQYHLCNSNFSVIASTWKAGHFSCQNGGNRETVEGGKAQATLARPQCRGPSEATRMEFYINQCTPLLRTAHPF